MAATRSHGVAVTLLLVAVCLITTPSNVSAVQLPKPQKPMTQNDNPIYAAAPVTALSGGRADVETSNRYGTSDLPDDSPLFKPPSNYDTPDQVKLTGVSPTEVWVTFTTGKAMNGTYKLTGSAPAKPASADYYPKLCLVSYGYKSGKYGYTEKSSTGYNYQQTGINETGGVYYTSPFLWTVKLKHLKPSTKYYYMVTNPNANVNTSKIAPSTQEYYFTTPHEVGSKQRMRIGIWGDLGETYNSSDTVQHLINNNPDYVFNMGDFCYADRYLNNLGTKWDFWGRLISPLIAYRPHSPTNGNHEIETSNGNNQGFPQVSYNNRYPQPAVYSKSSSNLYYSIEFGSVHFISLSQYTDYSTASSQYGWLLNDLGSVDRQKTPWIIVTFHGPVYHTYVTHYKQYDCWRQIYEPIFLKYGIDLVLSGHVHAYERSNPVANYKADKTGCAPTYMTIGDGGNAERLYHNWVDKTGNFSDGTLLGTNYCPIPDADSNSTVGDPNVCIPAYKVAQNLKLPYCTEYQPEWSAYREDAFGHAILDIMDGTTAELTWYRNLDAKPVATDRVKLQRDVHACPTRGMGGRPIKHHGHGHGRKGRHQN